MFERSISDEDVRHVLATGEVIHSYPEDKPYPSRLMLGWRGTRPVHVVAADAPEEGAVIIITVYEPSSNLWQAGFKERKPR
jgi:hypothetical protein